MPEERTPEKRDLQGLIRAYDPSIVGLNPTARVGDYFIQPREQSQPKPPPQPIYEPSTQSPRTIDARTLPDERLSPSYQLAQSLEGFGANLTQFLGDEYKRYTERSIAQGQAIYLDRPELWAGLIRQEQDPAARAELQKLNPWQQQAIQSMAARGAATEYQPWLRSVVESNPQIDDQGTRLFDVAPGDGRAAQYLAGKRSEFLSSRGLGRVPAEILASVVAPSIAAGDQQAYESYTSRYLTQQQEKTSKEFGKALINDFKLMAQGEAPLAYQSVAEKFAGGNPSNPYLSLDQQSEALGKAWAGFLVDINSQVSRGDLSESEAATAISKASESLGQINIGGPGSNYKPFEDDPDLKTRSLELATRTILALPDAQQAAANMDVREGLRQWSESMTVEDLSNPETGAALMAEGQTLALQYFKQTGDLQGMLTIQKQVQAANDLMGSQPADVEAQTAYQSYISGIDPETGEDTGILMSPADALRKIGGGDLNKGLNLVAGTGSESMGAREQILGSIRVERKQEQEEAEDEARSQRREEQEQLYRRQQMAVDLSKDAARQYMQQVESYLKTQPGIDPIKANQIRLEAQKILPQIGKAALESLSQFQMGLNGSFDAETQVSLPVALANQAMQLLQEKTGVRAAPITGDPTSVPDTAPKPKAGSNFLAGPDFAKENRVFTKTGAFSPNVQARVRAKYGAYTPENALKFLRENAFALGVNPDQYEKAFNATREKARERGLNTPLTRWTKGQPSTPANDSSWVQQGLNQIQKFFAPKLKATEQSLNRLLAPPAYAGDYSSGGGVIPPSSQRNTILAAARKYRVPAEILDSLIAAESSHGHALVSPAGARGWAQIMPETFRSLGGKNIDDPTENIMLGAKYLRQQYDYAISRGKGGWYWALKAYNAGPGEADNNYAETLAYADKVINRAKALGWGGGLLNNSVDSGFQNAPKMPFSFSSRSRAGVAKGDIWMDLGNRRGQMRMNDQSYHHIQFGSRGGLNAAGGGLGKDLSYKMRQAQAADSLIRHLHRNGINDIEIPLSNLNFHNASQVKAFLAKPAAARLQQLVTAGDMHHGGGDYWAIDLNFKGSNKRFRIPGFGRVVDAQPGAGGYVRYASGVEVIHASGVQGYY